MGGRSPAVKPALVIFDCDGVLVDSETISNEVLAQALTAEGLAMTTMESRAEHQGLLLDDIRVRAEARLGRRLPDGWIERYERDRTEVFRRELQAVAGVAEVVRRVRRAGVVACVASQGKLEKIELSLQLTGLDELFAAEELFSAYMVERGKPHPDLFLHAARTMGVAPRRCVVVEDTPSGVEGAAAAGMRVLGFSADSDEVALRRAGAQTFASMGELPRLLGLEGQRASPG